MANNAAIGTNSVLEVKKTNKRLEDEFTLTSSERKLKFIDQLHCEHYLKSPFHVIQLQKLDTEATKTRNDQPIEGKAMSIMSTSIRMDEQTISVKNPNYPDASGNRLVVLEKVKYLSGLVTTSGCLPGSMET